MERGDAGNLSIPVQGRPFVIVASQRTGSTLLVRSLDSSPKLLCAGEIFHPGERVHHLEYRFRQIKFGRGPVARLVNQFRQKKRVEKHLESFYERAGTGVSAVGFKLMISQIRTFPTITASLGDFGVVWFYLSRRSTFDAALSYFRARLSGIYHKQGVGAPHTSLREPVNVSEEEFGRLFNKCKADKKQLAELHRNHGGRKMAYEDMIAGWDKFIATIGDDLGVPDLLVQKVLSKIGDDGSGVAISNEDTLRERFSEDESSS
jgi:LPS sulfotransferase NodH